VAELEKAWHHRVAAPAYFPSAYAWPPSSVLGVGRPPRVVLLAFEGRDDGGVRLYLAQSSEGPLPDELLPTGVVMGQGEAAVNGAPAQLTRSLSEDGALWNEVRWTRGERAMLLRSRGSEEQLLRMAQSVRSEGHE
jgi:hypothetical protein